MADKVKVNNKRKRNKVYAILGYDEKENKYYGMSGDSMNVYRQISDNKACVYSLSSHWTNYEVQVTMRCRNTSDSIRKMYPKEPNSPNQMLWFMLRYLANYWNNAKGYDHLKWKVYRLNSSNCPVKIEKEDLNGLWHNKKKRVEVRFSNF